MKENQRRIGLEEGGRDRMKWTKKLYRNLLLLSVLILVFGQTAFAQDSEEPLYFYTVRVSAGDQGILRKDAKDKITVVRDGVANPQGIERKSNGDQIVVTGLHYGDAVIINPQDIAKEKDAKYSVKGVRRSGRDNSEATQSTGEIASDIDYVIAYRVDGDTVKYTVNYQDEQGNQLLDSDEYYGNVDERQYVSARYVDGYLPQAYNLVMTLSQNEAENVYTFRYTPVEAGGTTATEGGGTTTTTTGTGAGAGTTGAGAAGAGAGAAGADDTAAGANAGVGGDVAAVPDEEVPLDEGPEDLVDLDDEEVPLANMNQERPGKIMSYLPVYIGIGLVAAIALVATAIYLRKRRKVPAKEIVERIRNNEVK